MLDIRSSRYYVVNRTISGAEDTYVSQLIPAINSFGGRQGTVIGIAARWGKSRAVFPFFNPKWGWTPSLG